MQVQTHPISDRVAFSSEVATGSRKENASNKDYNARPQTELNDET
jgi:hypothetical protein